MSSNNPAPNGEKPPFILYLLAALFIPFIQPAKWLGERVYRGWDGGLRALLGILLGIGGAVTAGHYLGWVEKWPTYGWLPCAGLAWAAVYFYIWPGLYLFPIRPVWKLADAIYDRLRLYTKAHFEALAKGVVNVFATICLGSKPAWDKVNSKEHEESWFGRLVGILSGMTTIGATAYLGWKTYVVTDVALAGFSGIIGFVAAVAAGAFVFAATCGLMWQLLEYGKLAFIGLATGAIAVVGSAGKITALGASLGLNFAAGPAVSIALAYVLYVGYVFPLVNLMFTNGFWSWVWKQIKPLAEKAYDDKDKTYAELFHHGVNLLATAGVGYGVWAICAALSYGTVIAVVATALAAAATYVTFFKVLNHDGGNFFVGALLSLAAAVYAGMAYAGAGFLFGSVGAVLAGSLVLLFVGFIGFPVVYLGVRVIGKPVSSTGLGSLLSKVYNAFNEQVKKLLKEVWNAYRSCYDDKTGFKDGFLHVANIAVAVGAFFGIGALASYFGNAGVATLVFSGVGAALSYLLIGKLIFKNRWGLEFIGFCVALAVSGWATTSFYAANPTLLNKLVSVPVALAVLGVSYWLLFPVAYVIVRPLTNWLIGGFVKDILAGVYNACWSVFMVGWNLFVAAYKAIVEFLTPFWNGFVSAMSSVKKAYDRIMDAIAGRRRG